MSGQRLPLVVALALSVALLAPGRAAMAAGDPTPLARITAPSQTGHGRLQVGTTGTAFVPRGNDYVRLASYVDPSSGTTFTYHSTFEPGLYDGAAVDGALAYMRQSGYNTVRVFIDPGDPRSVAAGHPHGLGRGTTDTTDGYGPYYDDVADFLRRSAAHGIHVMPAMDVYPQSQFYWSIRGNYDPGKLNIAGNNSLYMIAGEIAAKQAYVRSFLTEIRNRVGGALMSTFLALELDNEATFEADQAPFASYAGTVTPANGVTYDMSKPADRQQAADASGVDYAIKVTDAVHAVDPQMLTTMGDFTYRAVRKPGPDGFATYCSHTGAGPACQAGVDYRYPARVASLSIWSTLAFLDIHVYPDGGSWSLGADLGSDEWSLVRGIVMMGELGAIKSMYNNDIVSAAYAMRDLQTASCQQGFSGWLFWTWDTTEDATQRLFYTATEQNGAINGQLAPVVRPTIC
jgi:hypothetical protein